MPQLPLLGDRLVIGDGWTNDDWATPWPLVRSLEAEFGRFQLDPCATPETAKAPRFYTRAEDGLIQPWFGRVWLNPPYSQKTRWLEAANYWIRHGAELIVALVPARTDAAWFHDCIVGKAEIRFIRRRVIFEGPDGRASASRPKDGTILAIYTPS